MSYVNASHKVKQICMYVSIPSWYFTTRKAAAKIFRDIQFESVHIITFSRLSFFVHVLLQVRSMKCV